MVDVRISIAGAADPSDLRSLRAWLAQRAELRGRLRAERAPLPPGAMGSTTDVLVVALGHGGAATALASVLISWIRRRTGTIAVHIRCACGKELSVEAENVRGVAAATMADQVAELGSNLNCGCSGK